MRPELISATDGRMADSQEQLRRLGNVLSGMLLATFLAVAASMANWVWVKSLGLISLTTLVGIAGGGIFGFIFGIPRSVSDPASANALGRVLRTNTNLEDLSDWLSKIIVGLGLTQLYQAVNLFNGFRLLLSTYVPPEDTVTPLIGTLTLIFGLLAGFLWLYLETRTNLARVLDTFDRSLFDDLANVVMKVASKLPGGGAEFAPAADVLKSVVHFNPDNVSLRTATAKALAAAGQADEADRMLPRTTDDVETKINRMFLALYREGGFDDALRIAGELGNSVAAIGRSDYWVYVAAAYGQRHHYLLTHDGGEQDIKAARDNALDAVRRAIALNPAEKKRLYWFANPENSPNPEDDDLIDFRDDPEFQRLFDGVRPMA